MGEMAYEMKIRGTEHEVEGPQPLGRRLAADRHARHLPPGLVVPDQQGAEGLRGSQGVRPRAEPGELCVRSVPWRDHHHPGAGQLLARHRAGAGRLQDRWSRAGQRLDLADPLPADRPGLLGLPAGLPQQRLGAGSGPAAGPGGAAGAGRPDAATHLVESPNGI
jgi:hypothetical protein